MPLPVAWTGHVTGGGKLTLAEFGNERRARLRHVVRAHPARPPRMGGRNSVEPNLTVRGFGKVATLTNGVSGARIGCPQLRFVCSLPQTKLLADSRDLGFMMAQRFAWADDHCGFSGRAQLPYPRGIAKTIVAPALFSYNVRPVTGLTACLGSSYFERKQAASPSSKVLAAHCVSPPLGSDRADVIKS